MIFHILNKPIVLVSISFKNVMMVYKKDDLDTCLPEKDIKLELTRNFFLALYKSLSFQMKVFFTH